jgi:hypothetical protein
VPWDEPNALSMKEAWTHDRRVRDYSVLRVKEVKTNTRPGTDAGKIAVVAGVIVWILILFVAVGLCALSVQQTKTVGERAPPEALLSLNSWRHGLLDNTLRQRNVALVREEVDAAFVRVAGDHAGARGDGVADRVGVHASVRSAPLYLDDDKVGDVLHVAADALLVESIVRGIADQEVACGASGHFVDEVLMDTELVLRPLHFNLE